MGGVCPDCNRRWRPAPGTALLRQLSDFLAHPRSGPLRFRGQRELCGACWRRRARQHYGAFNNPGHLILRALESLPRDRALARAWADEAVRRNPGLAAAYLVRAQIAGAQRDWPRALADCDRTVALNERDGEAWFLRSQIKLGCASTLKDRARARELEASAAADLLRAAALAVGSTRQAAGDEARDPVALLEQGRVLMQAGDWAGARRAASQALENNPTLIDAHMLRGFCGRKLGDFHEALADYTRAIELDSQHGRAWLDRGAVKVLIAYSIDEPLQAAAGPPYRKYCPEAVQWLLEAHVDYDKGAHLDPDDDSAGLSLLELEIILDRHKEAVARAAEWRNRIPEPGKRMACAWLGAIAFILAGKKERHWAQFREHLERNSTTPAWEPEQIDGYLARVQKEGKCPPARLADAQRVHTLFLSRYRSSKEASP